MNVALVPNAVPPVPSAGVHMRMPGASKCGCLRHFLVGDKFSGAWDLMHWVNKHPQMSPWRNRTASRGHGELLERRALSWSTHDPQNGKPNMFARAWVQHDGARRRFDKLLKTTMCGGDPTAVTGDVIHLHEHGQESAARTVAGVRGHCGPNVRFVVLSRCPVEQLFSKSPTTMATVNETCAPHTRDSLSAQCSLQQRVRPDAASAVVELLLRHFSPRNIMVVFHAQLVHYPEDTLMTTLDFLGANTVLSAFPERAGVLRSLVKRVLVVPRPATVQACTAWPPEATIVSTCARLEPGFVRLRSLLGVNVLPFYACSGAAKPLTHVGSVGDDGRHNCVDTHVDTHSHLDHERETGNISQGQWVTDSMQVRTAAFFARFPNASIPKDTACMRKHRLQFGKGVLPRVPVPDIAPSQVHDSPGVTLVCVKPLRNAQCNVQPSCTAHE